MKIKTVILSMGLFLLLSGFNKQNDCLKFRNGTFKIIDPATKKVCIITRKDDIQTERMEDSAETYDFKIKWVDDCTYTVEPTATTIERNREVLKVGLMTVTIVKTTDSSYTQKIQVEKNPDFQRFDNVFIVKKKERKTMD